MNLNIFKSRWKTYNSDDKKTWPENGDFVLVDLGNVYELSVFRYNSFLIAMAPNMTGQKLDGVRRYQKLSL